MPCLVREDRRSRARVEGSVSGREWTIERLEALRATIAAAREFVKRADECVPAYGDRFRPEELDDYYCALHQAIDAEDAAWDGCGVHRYEPSSANSSNRYDDARALRPWPRRSTETTRRLRDRKVRANLSQVPLSPPIPCTRTTGGRSATLGCEPESR